jgi:hypothetical protein
LQKVVHDGGDAVCHDDDEERPEEDAFPGRGGETKKKRPREILSTQRVAT